MLLLSLLCKHSGVGKVLLLRLQRYERLEANLPKDIMRYSTLAFPESSQLFPIHDTIEEYLKWYADDVCLTFDMNKLHASSLDEKNAVKKRAKLTDYRWDT